MTGKPTLLPQDDIFEGGQRVEWDMGDRVEQGLYVTWLPNPEVEGCHHQVVSEKYGRLVFQDGQLRATSPHCTCKSDPSITCRIHLDRKEQSEDALPAIAAIAKEWRRSFDAGLENEDAHELLVDIEAALGGTHEYNKHPEGCDCGGFDRNGSHSAGEYVGYCAQRKEQAKGRTTECPTCHDIVEPFPFEITDEMVERAWLEYEIIGDPSGDDRKAMRAALQAALL